jgi:hypothetical protein
MEAKSGVLDDGAKSGPLGSLINRWPFVCDPGYVIAQCD